MLALDRARGNAHKTEMLLRTVVTLLVACLPLGALAAQEASPLAMADRRLAVIAERLQGANVALCRQVMPLTGLILHSADQYGQPSPARFADGPVAVAQVLPASPAAAAGLLANDAVVAIGGQAVAELTLQPGHPRRDAAFEALAGQDPAQPLALSVRRGGLDIPVEINAVPGCRALVEVLTEGGNLARSDGRVIQVSQAMVARLSDDDLAVIVAHELAHAVLEHRRRLSAAGVETGFLGEFGRNRRLRRQVEAEADVLSVHLLANAGYDPVIAPRFWRSDAGAQTDSGILRSGAYHSRHQRAAMMEAEITAHLAWAALPPMTGPSLAGHLLEARDAPFPVAD
ncbi:MAG: peptidase M48 family protein [Pseudomonadota bacterium]